MVLATEDRRHWSQILPGLVYLACFQPSESDLGTSTFQWPSLKLLRLFIPNLIITHLHPFLSFLLPLFIASLSLLYLVTGHADDNIVKWNWQFLKWPIA